jgi:hypothetical protein
LRSTSVISASAAARDRITSGASPRRWAAGRPRAASRRTCPSTSSSAATSACGEGTSSTAGRHTALARAMIRAHLLRWRPRQPALVGRAEAGGEASESGDPGERERATESTPRRLPSGAASQLAPSHRSSGFSPIGS